MYQYRAREYNPALGRFLQRDPIGFADDYNLYRYVKNNPTTYTDPSGNGLKEILQGCFLGICIGVGNGPVDDFGVKNPPGSGDPNGVELSEPAPVQGQGGEVTTNNDTNSDTNSDNSDNNSDGNQPPGAATTPTPEPMPDPAPEPTPTPPASSPCT